MGSAGPRAGILVNQLEEREQARPTAAGVAKPLAAPASESSELLTQPLNAVAFVVDRVIARKEVARLCGTRRQRSA